MTFILIVIATFAVSLWAQARVKSAYAKYKKVPASSGYSGAQAAAQILRSAGIDDVSIHEHPQTLADHYDPIHKRLVLSSENYHGQSAAALGIAAHETGHAIQHKISYAPLKLRMAAVGLVNIANGMVMWLPLIGIFTGLIQPYTGLLFMAIGWGIIMGFNLITLPVEFDASRRAKLILDKMGLVRTQEETQAVSSMLTAAAWTYVAAFLTSLAYFLYFALPLLLGRRD